MRRPIVFAGLVSLLTGCSGENKPADPVTAKADPLRAKLAEVGLSKAYDACKNVDDLKKGGSTYDRTEFYDITTCLRSIVNSDSRSSLFKRRCELIPNSKVVTHTNNNASVSKNTVCEIALYL